MRSYLEMSLQLEQELASATAGDPVPSENDLAERFRVSRLTARAALQELERRHVVRRVQGRGTFVTRRLDYRITDEGPASFTEIVRAAGGAPVTTTDGLELRLAAPEERRALALGRRDRVVELRRTRTLDGQPVGVSCSVLPVSLVPRLEDHLADGGSLYQVLVDVYGLDPRRAWFRCEIVAAPREVTDRLELRGRPELLHSEGRLESKRLGAPIELNDGWLRTDVFNVVVEIGTFR